MANQLLQLRIRTEQNSARPVSVDDLQDTFGRLRKLTIATILDAGYPRADIRLSSGEFVASENRLVVIGNKPASVGLERICRALRERDLSLIPPEARQDLRVLWSKAHQREWTIEFGDGAILSGACELPTPSTTTGVAEIAGMVKRVHIDTNTLLLKLPSGDVRTFAIESGDLAQELSQRRYQQLVLRGKATWFVGTQQLADFVVTGIVRPGGAPAFVDPGW